MPRRESATGSGLELAAPRRAAISRCTGARAKPRSGSSTAGRLADGDRDAKGNSVEIRTPLSLALNGRGTALYAASRLGMQVFERDLETGGLTLVQSLEDHDLEDNSLIWDARRTKLYAPSVAGRGASLRLSTGRTGSFGTRGRCK